MSTTEQQLASDFLELKLYSLLDFGEFFESFSYLLTINYKEQISYEDFLTECINYCNQVVSGTVFHTDKNMLLGPVLLIWLKALNYEQF